MKKKKVTRYPKPEWSNAEDKTKYHWMRVERNCILIMYDTISRNFNNGASYIVWDGEVTFDEEVLWEKMIESCGLCIFPSNFHDCIILDKSKLLMGEQKFFHWLHGDYKKKSWTDKVLYTNAKRYNYNNRH